VAVGVQCAFLLPKFEHLQQMICHLLCVSLCQLLQLCSLRMTSSVTCCRVCCPSYVNGLRATSPLLF
jgi:hypothetical protein